ncbi:MAG: ABC transporter ATP-binding protein [Candidatus Riflebacteria bacterium HGW-Riflebacteria-1]|jgi:putative ABC transport system ATP-binding protein|nr:MAG: ABC transporter ATP-binding protein [Candidatus Riflebacteria bacterium HGW-Riflebacteria-1]
MNVLLKVEGLEKTFSTRNSVTEVFKNVSFEISPGEVVVIKGRSGEGKSTMLGILSGLDRQTAGSVVFAGERLESMTVSELAELRAQKIGMIFQSFNLIGSWTALENVEAVLMHRGISPVQRRQKAQAVLHELGLGERLDNYPTELSVGQQQRVAVARTLVNDPLLILADEPTGDVDAETAREVVELLLPRVRNGSAALLVATHGAFDLNYADRVLTLANRCLVAENGRSQDKGVPA